MLITRLFSPQKATTKSPPTTVLGNPAGMSPHPQDTPGISLEGRSLVWLGLQALYTQKRAGWVEALVATVTMGVRGLLVLEAVLVLMANFISRVAATGGPALLHVAARFLLGPWASTWRG